VDILHGPSTIEEVEPFEDGDLGGGAGGGAGGAGAGAGGADAGGDGATVSKDVRHLVHICSTVLNLGAQDDAATGSSEGKEGKSAHDNDTGSVTAGIESSGSALWVAQLKLIVLRALPPMLRVAPFAILAINAHTLPRLFVSALEPLRVPSMVPLTHLESRTVTFRQWLLEDCQEGGALLLSRSAGTSALKTPADVERENVAAKEAVAALESHGGTTTSMSAESRRWTFAKNLVEATRKPLGLCYQALLLHEDDEGAAVEWLITGRGDAWESDYKAGSSSSSEPTTWTCTICTYVNALEETVCSMCTEPRRSLQEVKREFLAQKKAGKIDPTQWLTDDAAMEGIADAPPLFPQAGSSSSDADATMSNRRLVMQRSESIRNIVGGSRRGMGAALHHEMDVGSGVGGAEPEWVNAGITLNEVCVAGSKEAESQLWEGMAVVADTTRAGFAVASLEATFGVLRRVRDRAATVNYFDPETGAFVDVDLNPKLSVLAPKTIAGAPVRHAKALLAAASATDSALTTHYARRAIVVLCNSWPRSSRISPSVQLLGGTQQLLSLVKLVAAGEHELGVGSTEDSSPTMKALRTLLQTLLVNEVGQARRVQQEAVSKLEEEEARKNYWQCPACTLHNDLDKPMCNLCNTPKPPTRPVRTITRLKPGPLGDALAKECETNIAGATEVDGGGDAVTIESLHDYRLNSNYKSEVYFQGASALRVMFDPRWCVPLRVWVCVRVWVLPCRC